MKKLYIQWAVFGLFTTILILNNTAYGQGCVAIRSGCGVNMGAGSILGKNQWQLATNFRYFHSFRHFRGSHEETERVENGTEVINDSYFTDLLLNYGLGNRLSLNLIIPFVAHNRSSMYEHGGNPSVDDPSTADDEFWAGDRHETSSAGLGDIRLGVNYWLLDPTRHSKTNIAVGLGLKIPSGNYRYEDTFYNPQRTAHVDQSIQPGDGGWGATIDVQAYHSLGDALVASANLYYLINPMDEYEVTNFRGASSLSIPDQYAARVGLQWLTPLHGWTGYLGARAEGIPSSDLIGEENGFRRPGYAISVEPGIGYALRNMSFNLTVPIALVRNRTKSFTDKIRNRHGDAAFADYLINFGFAINLNGHQKMDITPQ